MLSQSTDHIAFIKFLFTGSVSELNIFSKHLLRLQRVEFWGRKDMCGTSWLRLDNVPMLPHWVEGRTFFFAGSPGEAPSS